MFEQPHQPPAGSRNDLSEQSREGITFVSQEIAVLSLHIYFAVNQEGVCLNGRPKGTLRIERGCDSKRRLLDIIPQEVRAGYTADRVAKTLVFSRCRIGRGGGDRTKGNAEGTQVIDSSTRSSS